MLYWLRKHPWLLLSLLLFVVAVVAYTVSSMNQRLQLDPTSAKPLLNLIAQSESKGNYNAYFGNASNSEIKFTKMSVADVMKWQRDFVAAGNASSAVGKYQIIDTTLASLVKQHAIDLSQPFDETMQDNLAIALLERRGATDYVNKQLDKQQFAAELAKEWAALPKILGANPEQSYYASDGLNHALVGSREVLRAVSTIRPIER